MRVVVVFLSLCLTALPHLAHAGDSGSTRAVYTTVVLGAPDSASVPLQPDGSAALVYTYFGNSHLDLTDRLVYRIGGATQGADGHIWTKMLCDDLTYTTSGWPAYFGAYMLNDIVAGFNSTAGRGQQVGINFRFYDSDGVNAMPGTLLYSYGILQNFDGGDFYSINEFGNPFLLPPIWELHPRSANPLLWACVAFENLGNPDADIDFMNNLGVLLWDGNAEPGTSQGLFFVTETAWSADCPGNSPAGSTIENVSYNMHWLLQNRDYRALAVRSRRYGRMASTTQATDAVCRTYKAAQAGPYLRSTRRKFSSVHRLLHAGGFTVLAVENTEPLTSELILRERYSDTVARFRFLRSPVSSQIVPCSFPDSFPVRMQRVWRLSRSDLASHLAPSAIVTAEVPSRDAKYPENFPVHGNSFAETGSRKSARTANDLGGRRPMPIRRSLQVPVCQLIRPWVFLVHPPNEKRTARASP